MNYVHAIICLFHIVQHYSFTNKGTFSAMNYAGRLDSMVLRDPPYVMFINACFAYGFPQTPIFSFDAHYGFANHNKLLLSVILFFFYFFFILQTKSISYFHLQNQII